MAGADLAAVLDAAREVMRALPVFPLEFVADEKGADILAVMEDNALRTRSRGPYTPDKLPPEAIATIKWIALRLMMHQERPDFSIEGGGSWPRLLMVLPASRVAVRFIVPEEAPAGYQPSSGDATAEVAVRMAVEFVAKSLRKAGQALGAQPPMTVRLSYPDDPDHAAELARIPAEWHDRIMPVIPTIDLDRTRCGRRQRKAHDESIRAVAYSDQRIEPLGRKGFTTRLGAACVRDHG